MGRIKVICRKKIMTAKTFKNFLHAAQQFIYAESTKENYREKKLILYAKER